VSFSKTSCCWSLVTVANTAVVTTSSPLCIPVAVISAFMSGAAFVIRIVQRNDGEIVVKRVSTFWRPGASAEILISSSMATRVASVSTLTFSVVVGPALELHPMASAAADRYAAPRRARALFHL
jgi:hypothetical protein